MRVAVFPGSFDPVTNGHLDLIRRGAGMFDRLIIGVLVNIGKTPLFSIEERVDMLSALTREFPQISVKTFEGLLVDFVEAEGATVVLRGLRTPQDFSYELPLAQANYKLNKHADTIFLATAPEYSYISSSGVKEIFRFGGEIREMVPGIVYERLIRLK
ncbi:MAG: pantetheine-phosphate adenylyltransferase [Lachnospiraceae bacterium]|nr:pantetheine-phosphate adenylyltransferase [Lachnospiraceae bacterium]